MIHELRVYHTTPGKLPQLLNRFETITLKIWERLGIRQAGFWTTEIGPNANDLYYLLQWESLAEREEKWTAFATDPEWLQKKAETELADQKADIDFARVAADLQEQAALLRTIQKIRDKKH